MKFKVGDKVKVITSHYDRPGYVQSGLEGIITDINQYSGWMYVEYIKNPAGRQSNNYREEDIELLKPRTKLEQALK